MADKKKSDPFAELDAELAGKKDVSELMREKVVALQEGGSPAPVKKPKSKAEQELEEGLKKMDDLGVKHLIESETVIKK
jgi:hypothetical protein